MVAGLFVTSESKFLTTGSNMGENRMLKLGNYIARKRSTPKQQQ